MGRHIILPNDSLIRNLKRNYTDPLKKDIKILTIIDANCSECITNLKSWKKFITQIDTSQVGIVFVCHSIDHLMTFKNLDSTEINLSLPYFEDIGKELAAKNKLSDDKRLQTFLLDSANNVILVGNPSNNPAVAKLYEKEIKKLMKNSNTDTGNFGAEFKQEGNVVSISINGEAVWKDEAGNVLSEKQKNTLLKSGSYYMEHNPVLNEVILKNKQGYSTSN